MSISLASQVNTGFIAEAEIVHVIVKIAGPQLLADSDDETVRRVAGAVALARPGDGEPA